MTTPTRLNKNKGLWLVTVGALYYSVACLVRGGILSIFRKKKPEVGALAIARVMACGGQGIG